VGKLAGAANRRSHDAAAEGGANGTALEPKEVTMTGSSIASDLRPPAVAGRFYPDDPDELEALVGELLGTGPAARHLAVMVPHAGYVYSGGVAGAVFGGTVVPSRVVVMAPNHTGRGRPGALWARGAFALPGGELAVDEELGRRLVEGAGGLVEPDHQAHRLEHALEVELPFLRRRRPDLRLTPLVLGGLDAGECVALGEALAEVVAALDQEVLVVASSDMSHYLPDEVTREIDQEALEPLLAIDPERLYRVVRDRDISMCGVLPATAMLAYARACGASSAQLVAYATSGDAFGDRDRVVGYAGVTVD
jgi:AmmeMemoRadiSam system protein B